MAAYYLKPPSSYYAIADRPMTEYTSKRLPFHCDLVSRVEPGMTVIELGCGTAHFCAAVEARGGSYTGVDHNLDLLEQNRRRFPGARFLSVTTELPEQFDLVASLYTIEHVVDPTQHLAIMLKLCKPGGLLGIICPDFVESPGSPPSFYYGATPRRLRQKLKSLSFFDAGLHLVDLCWRAPIWRRRARRAPAGAFWINVKPRVFHGAQYSVDADAVHLPRLADLVWWLQKQDTSIVATSRTMLDVDPAILRYNCYALARKSCAAP
jgi:SAM-dependent methyltransferase